MQWHSHPGTGRGLAALAVTTLMLGAVGGLTGGDTRPGGAVLGTPDALARARSDRPAAKRAGSPAAKGAAAPGDPRPVSVPSQGDATQAAPPQPLPAPTPAPIGATLGELAIETAPGVTALSEGSVGSLPLVQATTAMIVADARSRCDQAWFHLFEGRKKVGYTFESCEVTSVEGKEVLVFHFRFVVPQTKLEVVSRTAYSTEAPGEIVHLETTTTRDGQVTINSLRREDKAWRYVKRGGSGGDQSRSIDEVNETLENGQHAFDALLRRGLVKPGARYSYRWFDPDSATAQRDGIQLLATSTLEVGGKRIRLHKVEQVLQLGSLRAEKILDEDARELVSRIKDRLLYRDTEAAVKHIPKKEKHWLGWLVDNLVSFLGVGIALVTLIIIFVVPMFKKAGAKVVKKIGAPGRAELVRHLLGKRFMISDASDSLWSVELDPERTKSIDRGDDARLAEIFEEEGLFGYHGRYFVKLAKDTWDSDGDTHLLEVVLFWEDHKTPFEVELELAIKGGEPRASGGKKGFSTGHAGFDGFFAKRVGNAPVIERLGAAGRRLDYVTDFAERWRGKLGEVNVSDTLEVKFPRSLLAGGKDPTANLEELLASVCRLAETIEQAIDPSFVAAPPPSLDGPRYAVVEVLHTCPRCRAGLPLNGPLAEVQCQQCQSQISLPPAFWDLLAEPHKSYLKGAGGFQRNFQTSFSWRARRPKCSKCGGELPVDEIGVGTTGSVFCPGCGAATLTFPAPAWLRDVAPQAQQIYGAEGAEGPGGATPLQLDQTAPAPIVMTCPQCGGGLTITVESTRTTKCNYCHVDVFLPDDLWKRLHPVKTATQWGVRYSPME